MQIFNFDMSSPRIQLYPNNGSKKCLECTSNLKTLYIAKARNIKTLSGEKRIYEHVWACHNLDCSSYQIPIFSDRETPPGSSFSFDVIAEVGRLRREDKKTYQEIVDYLNRINVSLGVSRSCAKHLFQYYEVYEILWTEEELKQQSQGQDVILSIDGAKPKKGSETLYIVSNAQTKEVYHDAWTLYSDTSSIKDILKVVKDLDLNVVGFVTDKQRTLLLGVQEIFGELPHQLCQIHWLQQISKMLNALDKQINMNLKKKLRKIRQLTIDTKRRVESDILPEFNLFNLKELEIFLTVILGDTSKPPFNLKGITNWYRIKEMMTSYLDLLEDYNDDVFRSSVRSLPPNVKTLIQVIRIFADIAETLCFDIKVLEIGLEWLIQIEELLDPKNFPAEFIGVLPPSLIAENRLLEFINNLNTHGFTFLEEFKETIINSMLRWSPNLFTTFDYPHIPRTNNKKEQFINQIKQSYSKITGRSRNHNILRHRSNFRYTLKFPDIKLLLEFCRITSRSAYRKIKSNLLDRIDRLKKEYRIKRDFKGMWGESIIKIKEELVISTLCT